MEERCTREVSDRDTAIEALKAEIKRLEGEKGGLSDSLATLRRSLAEKEQEKEALRANLAKAGMQKFCPPSRPAGRTSWPRVSSESLPLRRNPQLRWGSSCL